MSNVRTIEGTKQNIFVSLSHPPHVYKVRIIATKIAQWKQALTNKDFLCNGIFKVK